MAKMTTKHKRHVNIFCITSDKTNSKRDEIGISLALKGIRAKVFVTKDADLAGADYVIRKSIIDSLMRASDIIVVLQTENANDIVDQLEEAAKTGKPIWCVPEMKAVAQKYVKCFPGELNELCRLIIEE